MPEVNSLWPTSIEGWTTIAANLVTIFGGGWLVWNVSVKLGALLRLQQTATYATVGTYEASKVFEPDRTRPREAPEIIFNTWLRHAETERYVKGVSAEELRSLSSEQRTDYGLFVSRMLAAFDLILEDAPWARDNTMMQSVIQPRLRTELSKHIPILTDWPWNHQRLPTSPLLRQVVRELTTLR